MTGIAVEVAVGGITEINMMIVVVMVVAVMVAIVINRHESPRDGHPGRTV